MSKPKISIKYKLLSDTGNALCAEDLLTNIILLGSATYVMTVCVEGVGNAK